MRPPNHLRQSVRADDALPAQLSPVGIEHAIAELELHVGHLDLAAHAEAYLR